MKISCEIIRKVIKKIAADKKRITFVPHMYLMHGSYICVERKICIVFTGSPLDHYFYVKNTKTNNKQTNWHTNEEKEEKKKWEEMMFAVAFTQPSFPFFISFFNSIIMWYSLYI